MLEFILLVILANVVILAGLYLLRRVIAMKAQILLIAVGISIIYCVLYPFLAARVSFSGVMGIYAILILVGAMLLYIVESKYFAYDKMNDDNSVGVKGDVPVAFGGLSSAVNIDMGIYRKVRLDQGPYINLYDENAQPVGEEEADAEIEDLFAAESDLPLEDLIEEFENIDSAGGGAADAAMEVGPAAEAGAGGKQPTEKMKEEPEELPVEAGDAESEIQAAGEEEAATEDLPATEGELPQANRQVLDNVEKGVLAGKLASEYEGLIEAKGPDETSEVEKPAQEYEADEEAGAEEPPAEETVAVPAAAITCASDMNGLIMQAFDRRESGDRIGTVDLFIRALKLNPPKELAVMMCNEIYAIYLSGGQYGLALAIMEMLSDVWGPVLDKHEREKISEKINQLRGDVS